MNLSLIYIHRYYWKKYTKLDENRTQQNSNYFLQREFRGMEFETKIGSVSGEN